MCGDCGNQAYKSHKSGKQKSGAKDITIHYGSADLTGHSWLDTVCIGGKLEDGSGDCVKDFNFMAITDNIGGGLDYETDGILGLGATSHGANAGPSYLDALKDADKIDEAIVSF